MEGSKMVHTNTKSARYKSRVFEFQKKKQDPFEETLDNSDDHIYSFEPEITARARSIKRD